MYLNGALTTMTGAEAADRGAWPRASALGVLAVASNEVQVMEGSDLWLTPQLTTRPVGGADVVCGSPAWPDGLADPPSRGFVIALPSDGIGGPCTFGATARTDGGIDTIIVGSSAAWTGGGDGS